MFTFKGQVKEKLRKKLKMANDTRTVKCHSSQGKGKAFEKDEMIFCVKYCQ